MQISLTVNGARRTLDVPPSTLLVDLLRQHLGLTGTHVGCDTSQCGACTVHLDGRVVKACTVLAGQADGAEVTTIEGVGTSASLHPMQVAFRESHALQCGFCTPGMIMAAIGLIESGELAGLEASAARVRVREGLAGNLCRCTGYQNIVDAVLRTAALSRDATADRQGARS